MTAPTHTDHSPDAMTPDERRAGATLAAIFGLRMLGLFLILPVFTVAARALPHGTDTVLVGIALGAYGATQALLHIPLGLLSDRIGRKPVIIGGLAVFVGGCLLAAAAQDMPQLILGRVVQGMGAISAVVSALAADLTRPNQRTKIMAMIGSTIGLVFAVSLVMAPPLYAAIGLRGIFLLTGALALGGIALVLRNIPAHTRIAAEKTPLRKVLLDRQLALLNFGVLSLHIMQTALWVVTPALLVAAGLPLAEHWRIYLPTVLIAFALIVPVIIHAERRQLTRPAFLVAITLLIVAQSGFALTTALWPLAASLLAFFVGFNLLEAMQPALISRAAPSGARGAAMGIYNTTQSLGVALGGVCGGWLIKHVGGWAAPAFCASLGILWLGLAASLPLRRKQDG